MAELYSLIVRESLRIAGARQAQNVTRLPGPLYRIAMAPRLSLELLGPVRSPGRWCPARRRHAQGNCPPRVPCDQRPSGEPREPGRPALARVRTKSGAHGALRRTLSVLKAALGGIGLVIDRSSVGLRPEELEVDAGRFRKALSRVRGHDHRTDGPLRRVPGRARRGGRARPGRIHVRLRRALQRVRRVAGGRGRSLPPRADGSSRAAGSGPSRDWRAGRRRSGQPSAGSSSMGSTSRPTSC